jgi:glucitol operon activator protein
MAMAIWQWALLSLGVVWAIQALGVWLQMRHYTDVFKGITNQFNDGFVGAGHARGRFRKGTIAMVVISPDQKVQRLLTMTGRSVFAKFQRNTEFEGITLPELKARHAAMVVDNFSAAIGKAIEQVEHVRSKPRAELSELRLTTA